MTQLKKVSEWIEELSEEVSAKNENYEIWNNTQRIGQACMVITENDDDEYKYLERIEIDDEHQGEGHGTEAIRQLAKMYRGIYFAPDNEGAQRLYERIATETTDDYMRMSDQGYGVYEL